jgi:hypothetical protein
VRYHLCAHAARDLNRAVLGTGVDHHQFAAEASSAGEALAYQRFLIARYDY